MRGDLVFAGLIYTFIGVAAAVMTTNGPLMPFFFPVVAGVGLLGPVAAVGFYELARRHEEGLESGWKHMLDVRRRPSVDDMGIVAGLLLGIFLLWLLAAGLLYVALFSQWIGFFAWNAGMAMGGIARVSQVQLLQPFVVFALAAVFNDETITPQIVLFAAGVVATVAISTRTRGRKAPDRPELTSVPGITPPAKPT